MAGRQRAPPSWEGEGRCQPKTTTGDVHPGLTQRRASGFASGIERPIDLEVSKAGELYYLSQGTTGDRKSTRLNSSHANISYAVFCLKKKKEIQLQLYILCWSLYSH